jgi:hypothetical protein
MITELRRALEQVARRFRHTRLWAGLTVCWLVWALAGVCLWLIGSQSSEKLISDGWLLALLCLVVVSGVGSALAALWSVRDSRWVARRIEAKHPELGTGLLAAVEEVEATPTGRFGFLQSTVIRQVLDHRRNNDWDETVPTWKLRVSQLAHGATLGVLIAVVIALATQARSQAEPRIAVLSEASPADVQVEPGDTEVERGTPLLVVAHFKGGVPPEATLVVEDPTQKTAQHGMTRSLEDPTFAGHVESVETDLAYRVQFQGKSTEAFHVRVFEYPELERADAKLVFPQYTSLEPKSVEDIRHVTAVEGTELTLLCRLNKDVATARLVDAEGHAIDLEPLDDGKHVYRTTLTLAEQRRFKIQLIDKEGRTNKLATEIVANVTRNHPPVVKVTQPAHDVQVSPLEELKLKADLEDDFGLVRHGLSYSMAGREPHEIDLPVTAAKTRQLRPEHMIDFESLHAAPDQLLTYFFWAEDIGPDGQPRRTSGDMFFAEVRPFEEIFRQGEQPPSGSAENEEQEGQQGNAQASDRLAELQKEIINGTWKLIRRETVGKPTVKLTDDAKVLDESQSSAIEQANQLAARLQDAASKANLEQAVRSMKDAEKRLGEVVKITSPAGLTPALAAEQAAYQALLRLRAREFEVIRRNSRQQRQGGRNSGGNRSQRQLQQLELTDEQNRYEDQRTARAQQGGLSKQEQEQRETGQVLNRLRELAQRQNDVNDRLKELQSALEAAKTQPAREEIERQLKRLREQQQQILRDTDELRERMEREENRERMANAREQVDESREHVRQASEALEQGRVPQALTEGARAGRQFNDLREELRKGAANRFSQEMTEMRDQARRLDENQKKLSEQLEAVKDRPPTSLRDTGERKQVTQGLDQQQKNLDKLLEQMRTTVETAEETEPLLAKNLYDTVRKANDQKIPDALKAAEQLAELGVNEDAAKASRHAGQGIEQMREGVERSARSVLGDETAALRRVQGELEDLADQVNDEIAQATGQDPAARQRRNARTNPDGQRAEQGQEGARGGQQPENLLDGISLGGNQRGDQEQQGQPGNPAPGGQRAQQQQQQRQGQRNRQGAQGERGQQAEQGQQGEQQAEQGEEAQQGQPGRQGQQQGRQAGQQGQEPGQQGEQGQQRQQGQGQAPGGNEGQGGQPQQRGQGQQDGQPGGSLRGGGADRLAGGERQFGGAPNGPGRPITGEGFRQWSDRMRDVEELLDDPELRAEAARIRDRARAAREEYKRHAKQPDWNKLRGLVAEPIDELRDRIAEEVRRRQSPDALVPIDRDPVPPQFTEGVRSYYERLGSGQ